MLYFHEQNFPFSTSVLPDLTATPLPLVSLTDDPLMLSNPNPQLTDVPEQSHLPHSTSTDLHFSSSSSELNPSLPHDEATSLPSPIEGVDFFDSFSPVAKTVTVRIMFSIASAYSWPIHQLDINNAFLHGYLDEAVYMTPPEGYEAPWDGLEVARSSDGLSVSQHKYICDIVTELHLQMPRLVLLHYLLVLNLVRMKGLFYRSLIGTDDSLGNFCTLVSQDQTFPLRFNNLVNSCNIPHKQHWDAAIHVVRYLKGSSSMALFFPSQNSLQLSAFSDADWATCVDSRRSVTGYCIFLGSSLILED
ncbi:UNVERIFIED_CONTAM: Retrovirus-related Pol polyprotein from transposon RE2 [Sesamum radiatum]|uniref:Retrovirus-related Pol polyprotein from transposon RE2 n=1 Tax=Sesamum radiatum TaxID=300843 RepID=A0AAW2S7I8_SESRA